MTSSRSGTRPSRSDRHCSTRPASSTGAPVRSATTARSSAAGISGAAAISAASSPGTPASRSRPARAAYASASAPSSQPGSPARTAATAGEPVRHRAQRQGRLDGHVPLAQQPARTALGQPGRLPAQLHLDGGGHPVVQRPDGVPHPVDLEDRACDGVRPDHRRQWHPALLRQPEQPGHPGDVDRPVGERGRHDLAAQRVRGDGLGEALAQRPREVVDEQPVQRRVVGQRGAQHGGVGVELGVGQEHGELGTGQPLAVAAALGQLPVVGQRLHRPLEPARALQRPHEALVGVEQAPGRGGLGGQRHVLGVVVGEDGGGHLVGHLAEQLGAVLGVQRAAGDHGVERDLDVDLVVGGVDARGVVDGVGVHPPAGQRVLDPAALGEPEVAALADDPHP